MELSPEDTAVLDLARRHYRYAGSRDDAIRRELGMSPWQFQQRLFAICQKPEALAAYPSLVNRVNRRRRVVRSS
jgi:hypothetical protein